MSKNGNVSSLFCTIVHSFTHAETLNATIVTARETEQKAHAKVDDITAKLADAKGYKERELKAATEDMKEKKKLSELSQKNWKKHEQECETLKMHIAELISSNEKQREQVAAQEATIEKLRQKVCGVARLLSNEIIYSYFSFYSL